MLCVSEHLRKLLYFSTQLYIFINELKGNYNGNFDFKENIQCNDGRNGSFR